MARTFIVHRKPPKILAVICDPLGSARALERFWLNRSREFALSYFL
jgi:hypothetical protein